MKRKLIKFFVLFIMLLGLATFSACDKIIYKDNGYEKWLEEGYSGTIDEFYSWINQSNIQAKEVYEYWKSLGNSGTIDEFKSWINESMNELDASFEYWKSLGNNGTIDEFKSWINEKLLPNVNIGYQKWLELGNTGTESDFNEWLYEKSLVSPFANVRFEASTVIYDGQIHELLVTGLSDEMTVTYSNNRATDVGVYRAFAFIDNKEDVHVLTTTLTIKKATISEVSFIDTSVIYDGTIKNVTPIDLPSGVTASYFLNDVPFMGAVDSGIYELEVLLEGTQYESKLVEVTLMVNKANIENISFTDDSFEYDTNNHMIEISGNLPIDATLSYVDSDGILFEGAIIPGEYRITAKVTGCKNHNDFEITATLTIDKAQIKGLSFTNKSVVYDGNVHYNLITGILPFGTEVVYKRLGNSIFDGAVERGSYYLIAVVSGEFYEQWSAEATLYITAMQLAAPTGLVIGDTSGTYVYLNWNRVTSASSYQLNVYNSAGVLVISNNDIRETEAEIRLLLTRAGLYADTYTYKVIAHASSINMSSYAPSNESEGIEFVHDRAKLIAPSNLRVEDGYLKWDSVPGGVFYRIEIEYSDGTTITRYMYSLINKTSCALSAIFNEFNTSNGTYRFRVQVGPSVRNDLIGEVENVTLRSDWSDYIDYYEINY